MPWIRTGGGGGKIAERREDTLLCDCYVSENWLPVGSVSVLSAASHFDCFLGGGDGGVFGPRYNFRDVFGGMDVLLCC